MYSPTGRENSSYLKEVTETAVGAKAACFRICFCIFHVQTKKWHILKLCKTTNALGHFGSQSQSPFLISLLLLLLLLLGLVPLIRAPTLTEKRPRA